MTRFLIFLSAGPLCLLMQEVLARNSMLKAAEWVRFYPSSAALNLTLIYGTIALSVALLGKFAPALILSTTVLLLLSVLNYTKLAYLQSPFFPWDLLYVKNLNVLFPALPTRTLLLALLLCLAAALGGCLIAFLRQKGHLSLKLRIPLLVLSVAFWIPFWQGSLTDILAFFRLQNATWNQPVNYEANGFLAAFSMNLSPLLVSQPGEYGEEVVRRLVEHNEALKPRSSAGRSAPATSLIVFVSESFCDLRGVRFAASDNPLETLDRLWGRFPSFQMVSPAFGGNTSIVEFEILTGLSNAFLPRGAIPYDHYLKKETPSIAQILKSRGYRVVAIHPYHDWFWNRHKVYPRLGFEDFISLSGFEGAEERGGFVSDSALVDKVIATIEETDRPFFLFALSMQNHGSYWPNRYAPDQVEVDGDFPEPLRRALQTYVTGLRDADRQFGRLLDYLQTRQEPILCLFTGDHLPTFGPEFALYRESGAISSAGRQYTREETFRMSEVPCLLWSNREDLLDVFEIPEHISPAHVPALLLHQMGIELPNHMFFLFQGLRDYPVIHRDFVLRRGSHLADFEMERNEPFLRDLELFQFDVLFGSRYSLDHGPVPEQADGLMTSALPARM